MIEPDEIKVEGLSHPPGGQHVGVRTGVKITHLPTGLVALCETERSQHRNRQIAMDMILGGLTSPHFPGSGAPEPGGNEPGTRR
jgi:peptide chain release factor 2